MACLAGAVASSAVPGWPDGVKEVAYRSAADGTDQPALFYNPGGDKAVPLLVALHTWSNDHLQREPHYAKWCVDEGWAMMRPSFRGANKRPAACGSDLAVQDILSAVEYAQTVAKIDPDRIYLTGASGGGHMSMLMAGRAPQVWAGVSAWCGIYDLRAWHAETKRAARGYWKMMEQACGGAPGDSTEVDREYAHRSPSTHLHNARGLPLDINTGIRDGHKGSVPVSHSLNAFNAVCTPELRIPQKDIDAMCAKPTMPEHLQQDIDDPIYGKRPALYRRVSGSVRVTVFLGAHEMIPPAALTWLAQQRRGEPAVWGVLDAEPRQTGDAVDVGQ